MKDDSQHICQEYSINPENTVQARNVLEEHDVIELSKVFKIMGSPIRLSILLAIDKQELCVCEISEVVNLSISAVSHHLRILRDNRLVQDRRKGKQVYYSLKDKHVSQLLQMMTEHLDEMGSKSDRAILEPISNENTQ